jgi:uncharacterized protein (UPF0335 family)
MAQGTEPVEVVVATTVEGYYRTISQIQDIHLRERAADIRDVYAEAKGNCFEVKILRQIIRLRKLDKAELQEQDALLDLYMHALGMDAGGGDGDDD